MATFVSVEQAAASLVGHYDNPAADIAATLVLLGVVLLATPPAFDNGVYQCPVAFGPIIASIAELPANLQLAGIRQVTWHTVYGMQKQYAPNSYERRLRLTRRLQAVEAVIRKAISVYRSEIALSENIYATGWLADCLTDTAVLRKIARVAHANAVDAAATVYQNAVATANVARDTAYGAVPQAIQAYWNEVAKPTEEMDFVAYEALVTRAELPATDANHLDEKSPEWRMATAEIRRRYMETWVAQNLATIPRDTLINAVRTDVHNRLPQSAPRLAGRR